MTEMINKKYGKKIGKRSFGRYGRIIFKWFLNSVEGLYKDVD
jgi:hypothetical protein